MLKIDVNTQIQKFHIPESHPTGCRINKIAKAVFIFIEVGLTITVTAFATLTVLNPLMIPFTALLITSIALCVLLGNRILNCVQHKLPECIQITANTIRGFIVDIFAFIGCISLMFIDMTKFDPKEIYKSTDSNKDIPLILIHGYMHNSSGWLYTRYRLRQAGYKNIYFINLGRPTLKSIDEYATKVNLKIHNILEKHKLHTQNQIRLIGHSMGGLVAVKAMLTNKGANILNVVTLGSPLQGTYLAKLAPGKCAFEMRYNTPFNQQLTKELDGSISTKLFYIGSQADLIIRPTLSATLGRNSGDNITILPRLGHISFLFNDIISDILISKLK